MVLFPQRVSIGRMHVAEAMQLAERFFHFQGKSSKFSPHAQKVRTSAALDPFFCD
jgi:hypothetical protein